MEEHKGFLVSGQGQQIPGGAGKDARNLAIGENLGSGFSLRNS